MTLTAAPVRHAADHLTADQVKQFHRKGFLTPLTACSEQEMEVYRAHIDKLLLAPGPCDPHPGHNRHLDDRTMFELSTLPAILGAMQSVVGPDLLIWRTNFFNKPPRGGKEIPWHQDRNYWPLEPEMVISAWIAVDQSTVENSCLQVIPGSHRKNLQHIKATPEMEFHEMASLQGVDMSTKVDVELLPGQFVLFNERTLHHSDPNRSERRRLGLAIRMIIPIVRVLHFDSPQHKAMLACGQDRMGFNEMVDPPGKDLA